jgi:transmembrane sensor
MDIRYNKVEDFLADESFLNYYFEKDSEDSFYWQEWIEDNQEQHSLITEARSLLDILSLKWSKEQISHKYSILRRRMEEPVSSIKLSPWSIIRNNGWSAAASIIIILFCSAIYIYKNPINTATSTYSQYKTIVNNIPNNDIKVIYLSDGSVVRLNANSKIEIASDYGSKTRKIILTGEAYFEVAKNQNLPFEVYAGSSKTTAIGTAFNVRAFPNESEVKVSLVEGKVQVDRPNIKGGLYQTAKLVEGQQIRLIEKTQVLTPIEIFKPQVITAWKEEGYIQLENTPFGDVLSMIESFHKVKIKVENDQLLKNNISGSISRRMSIVESMEILSFANKFNYNTLNDSTIIIK